MTQGKKLIEVALPLDAINKASAREKSIRHGHPSTLHLWWARRPLAASRAVVFASLVPDPDDLLTGHSGNRLFVANSGEDAVRVLSLGKDGSQVKGQRELPSLILESDIIDISSYSEVDTRNKIDAFIETLESIEKSKVA